MSKPTFTILAITLICCMMFERSAQSQSRGAKEGTATVSGRVTVKGEPAPGITVTLQPQRMTGPPNPEDIPSAKTDENGNFSITGVAAGRYFAMPQAPGFIMPGGMPGMRSGRTLHVADGENIEKIEIELKRGSVITGRVTGLNGRPLVDERVELSSLDNNGKPQQLYLGPMLQTMQTTDDRGVYRIYGLPEGRYLVSVGYSQGEGGFSGGGGGAQYPKTYHPDVTDRSQAKAVEVGEGDEVTGIDINVGEAKKTYSIFGRVVNADNGQPLAGASISLGALSPDGSRMAGWGGPGTRSNSRGEFQLSNVAPGKYAVFTTADYGLDRGGVDYFSEPVICEVDEGDKQGIEIKVRKGGSISGLVVIEGANDPAVSAKLSQIMMYVFSMPGMSGQLSTPYNNQIKVNPNGSFQINGLPPGKVRIDLMTPAALPGLSLLRIERDGVPQSREGIDIGAGEQVSNLRVVTAYGTLSVRGEVQIVGGTLPQELFLFINAQRGDGPAGFSRGSDVDARGHFVIEHLTPGEYEFWLSIRGMQPGPMRLDPQLGRKISQVRQKVLVSGNNQQPVIMKIDLSQGGSNQ
jgi:Carboxypeptidase regulatory-like domain